MTDHGSSSPPPVDTNLGNLIDKAALLGSQGKLDEAERLYRTVLSLDGHNVTALHHLGVIRTHQGKLESACRLIGEALCGEPDSASAHNSLGIALTGLGRCQQAIAHFETSVALDPGCADVYTNLGNALVQLGRLDEAFGAYRNAVDRAPRNATFHRNLAYCKRVTRSDPHLAAMEVLARDVSALPAADQASLHFALGKAYADVGEPDRSFQHLLLANALARQLMPYNEPRTLGALSASREIFTRELMRTKSGLGDPSAAPVFIVGMPRSGTTLVEQILASHPGVFGAGELPTFERILAEFRLPGMAQAPFPHAAATLTGEHFRQIGQRYLRDVRAMAPDAERIVDKMPANFRFVGLIHLALPNARIIHVRRDPLDTCMSCFSIQFTGWQPHTHDLAELGRYYRAYQTLMDHWHAVLPSGVMLDVRYEDVIADVEPQARRIIDHCGLSWNDACLRFHETQRPVKTASAAQVRQPIYRNSIGRWRPYAHHLDPLLQALGTPGDVATP